MKYYVNDDCIGCGACNNTCPEVFEMTDEAHIITYEQMQSFIHTLHVFDYIRQIIENETNKLVVVNDSESPDVLQTDSYLHKLLELGK